MPVAIAPSTEALLKENNAERKLPQAVTIKGSMHAVNNSNYIVFMCSLNVTVVRELVERNLFISDIQRHDSTRDLIMLNQSRMSQMELK